MIKLDFSDYIEYWILFISGWKIKPQFFKATRKFRRWIYSLKRFTQQIQSILNVGFFKMKTCSNGRKLGVPEQSHSIFEIGQLNKAHNLTVQSFRIVGRHLKNWNNSQQLHSNNICLRCEHETGFCGYFCCIFWEPCRIRRRSRIFGVLKKLKRA